MTNPKIAGGAVTATKLGTIQTAQKTLAADLDVGVGIRDDVCGAARDHGLFRVAVDGIGRGVEVAIGPSFKSGNGWRVAVHNNSGGNQSYLIEAYCLKN